MAGGGRMSLLDKSASKAQLIDILNSMKFPIMGAGGGFAPIGTINSYMGTVAPIGWLVCDGTVYNIADYPDLATHIASQFGSTNFFGGDGTTTFAVPDTTDITSATLENGVFCVKATVAGDPNGHVYSTEEQVVGTWIDGGDVYERTVTGLSINLSSSDWTTISGISIQNISRLIDVKYYRSSDSAVGYSLGKVSGNSVQLFPLGESLANADILTIQYTKTS
jgi:hypothetical protein